MSTEPDQENVLGRVQSGSVDVELLGRAARETFNYSVSFMQNGEQRGSGTLVEINGVKGILTAFHVAEPLFRNEEHPVGIIISENRHIFELPHLELEHIPAEQAGTILGDVRLPDVSFIRFLDPSRIPTISAFRSFYIAASRLMLRRLATSALR